MTNDLTETTNTTLPAEMADRFAALREQAAHAIEIWQPEPGECLLGVITGQQRAAGVYGENLQLLISDPLPKKAGKSVKEKLCSE